jgi:c-di-GMP-binding flagellar brake protein YcgR
MSEVNPEKQFNRKFIRVDTRMDCEFKHTRAEKELSGKGMILDISGGGLKLMATEHLKPETAVIIKTEFNDGTIELPGKVMNAALDWYVGDDGKKTFWTMGIQFGGLSAAARSRVIAYVHKRLADVREARLKRINPFRAR